MRMLIVPTFVLAALSGLGACAASEPTARMASAQAAIQTADQVGAKENPTAALHLQYAREQYSQAQTLTRDGHADRAALVLQRAQADAELAVALSRGDAAKQEAQEALERVRTSQSQMQAQ